MPETDDGSADALPDLTIEDVIYWMGWHMDSQRRIYDVLLSVLASNAGGAKAKELQELHERGKFLYPPAYMHDQGDGDED